MPTGVILNVLSVAVGGVLGALLKDRMSKAVRDAMNLCFGLSAICMGICSVILMKNMAAVILSVIVGTTLGVLIHLGDGIRRGGILMQRVISRVSKPPTGISEEDFISSLITVIVLFCSSGTGIYGSIVSGMNGDHSILIAKSVLDLFTAMIFACNLGAVVSVIALPQTVIFMVLFLMARFIYPLTTPVMIDDFKACGGFLLIATGFRMLKVKEFPIADMIPAMLLVMPVSALWTQVLLPLL